MAILDGINFKNRVRKKINDFHKKTPNFLTKRKLALLSLTITLLAAIPLHRAHAQIDIIGGLSTILQTVLFAAPYFILYIFTWIATVFVYIATYLVDAALNPGIYLAVINSAGVDKGWTIMRDTANLFFILILIFIALATTLRLQSYSAKTWIPKLLFGALFINYSKVITLFIIDIGNMFMYGVISWMGGSGLSNTGIGALHKVVVDMAWNLPILNLLSTGVTITQIIQAFAAFMFAVFLMLTLFGFGALLQIRVAMLTILTIFSPIAFMLHAWPNAGRYAGQWWSALLKYIVFGPIAVFFLYIAGEMAVTMFSMGALAPAPTGTIGSVELVSFGGPEGIFANVIPFVVVIVMLLAGLNFTSEMGIVGAGLITGTVKGLGMAAGAGVGYLAGKSILNKVQRGSGWAGGVWKAKKQGNLRDYLAKTGRNLPRQVAGGAWSATGGAAVQVGQEMKDQVIMLRNKMQEAARKKAEEKAKKLNMDSKEAERRRDSAQTAEEAAGYQHYLDSKGKSMFSHPDEEEIEKEIRERERINLNDPQIPILKQQLDALRQLNKTEDLKKAEKVVKISLQGGIDKGEFANVHPELAPLINGRSTEEQISKMVDEGVSFNKVSPDAYKNSDFLVNLRKIAHDNDPDKFNNHLKNRSTQIQNNSKETLKELLARQRVRNFVVTTPDGFENFQNASTLTFLEKGNIASNFQNDAVAISEFSKNNYNDLDKFDKASLEAIADVIDENTLRRIRADHLTPANAQIIARRILAHRQNTSEHTYISGNPMWRP